MSDRKAMPNVAGRSTMLTALLDRVALRLEARGESFLEEVELLLRSRSLLLHCRFLLLRGVLLRLLLRAAFFSATLEDARRRSNRGALAGVVVCYLANDCTRGRAAHCTARALSSLYWCSGLLCWCRSCRWRRRHWIDTGLSLGPGVTLTFILALLLRRLSFRRKHHDSERRRERLRGRRCCLRMNR